MIRARRYAVPAAVAAVALGVAVAGPVQAYQHWPNNAHLTYGASGQQFWIGPDAQVNQNAIIRGVQSWNAASGEVSYSETGTQANSRLDFTHPAAANGTCANTQFFVDTTLLNPGGGAPTRNYWWAKVQVRDALNNTNACGPVDHRRGIMAHEMGHALGLAHVDGGGARIMQAEIAYPQWYDVNTPQPDDVNGVNALY